MMFGYHHDLNAWGWAAMSVSMILFWGLLITGIVLAARYLGQAGQPPLLPPAPRGSDQVLAERFARGEIDADEYTSRLATLHR
jgi:putative membrane protein